MILQQKKGITPKQPIFSSFEDDCLMGRNPFTFPRKVMPPSSG
jgi:hypothetical protein